MPLFKPGRFYPIKRPDTINKYKVLGKVGYGRSSTSWLCRCDEEADEEAPYAVLKFHASSRIGETHEEDKPGANESEISRRIRSIKTSYPGTGLVRAAKDEFTVECEAGAHRILVQRPLLANLHEAAKFYFVEPKYNCTEPFFKTVLRYILLALDFLYREANVIHTNGGLEETREGTDEGSITQPVKRFARYSGSDSYVLFHSIDFDRLAAYFIAGKPTLCDFGDARVGKSHRGVIQQEKFRAPEVVLGMEWDEKVDVWNLGVLAWGMYEGSHLFSGKGDAGGDFDEAKLLAEMTALMDPPPSKFRSRSPASNKYWGDSGNWTHPKPLPTRSLLTRELRYASPLGLPTDAQQGFLAFMRKVLTWDPTHRGSARDLLSDDWLVAPTAEELRDQKTEEEKEEEFERYIRNPRGAMPVAVVRDESREAGCRVIFRGEEVP
ncbi:kinase-like protein [Aulographum hederae CBS 113979]|uniref:non-specific serine/threonine protein kinase n=1 Tax=Aulographum hederae CBS 113979 TaxID=1176131 RepID=A0A6G1GT45_9PEZI|nr:kinase-like protein [Aulographum hederae CBS 113979]